MRGNFEIPILGRCLIGTYALRRLTKFYVCAPGKLLTIAFQPGSELEFTVLMLKYAKENYILQSEGQNNFKEITEFEIEKVLDEIGSDEEASKVMVNALFEAITGKTLEELAEEKKDNEEQSEEPAVIEETTKKNGSTTGKALKKSLGSKELSPTN